MKFLSTQLSFLLTEQEARRNLSALLKYLAFLTGTVLAYSVLFHVLMVYDGQQHSWLTGLYWTLTVMSTLGFGDITFQGDLGRAFSVLVLLSGIVLLLIVLPFAFIRFFYAPWLEAQLRLRAPRAVPSGTRGHVILCRFDEIARGLIDRLREEGIGHTVIEPDPTKAAEMHADGISVVAGDYDSKATYEALNAPEAALVVANLEDAVNTNITLTVREACGSVPILALAEEIDSVDVLELSGATSVLPLKHRLGEQLATRVMVGTASAHQVGRFKDLVIAEFPVHNTPLAGRTVADTRLRQLTGLNVIAYSERGQIRPARADTVLTDYSIAVVVGTESQIASLDALFVIYEPNENPVVVLGGGKVGQAVARALKAKDVNVNLVERDPAVAALAVHVVDEVITGDASDISVVTRAGISDAPSVVLTTNDDATNIFLTIYCRRLNPDTRIVSRVTHERNLEAIHRAGADFVLSEGTLGVTSILARVHGRELVLAGEGVDLLVTPVPPALFGKTLAESEIGSRTGLNVVAVQKPGGAAINPGSTTLLTEGEELALLGTVDQCAEFRRLFGAG